MKLPNHGIPNSIKMLLYLFSTVHSSANMTYLDYAMELKIRFIAGLKDHNKVLISEYFKQKTDIGLLLLCLAPTRRFWPLRPLRL